MILSLIERKTVNKVLQAEIIREFGVKPTIDPHLELFSRVEFVKAYLRKSLMFSTVLGISGGVDSTTAGWICQQAAIQLRAEGLPAEFIAVRLPYGTQRDEDAAQAAIDFIKPDRTVTINIKASVDEMMVQIDALAPMTDVVRDFHKGNIKARTRMIAQYAVAGIRRGIVIGTDHASEGLMGFFTKGGDGMADILPLAGLDKDQVRQCCETAGADAVLHQKPATADLEDLDPGKLDVDSFGVGFDTIHTYLTGGDISDADEAIILAHYFGTQHKRALPVTPEDFRLATQVFC